MTETQLDRAESFIYHVLDMIGAFDHPIVHRACNYLLSITTDFDAEGYIHPPLDWAPTPQSFMRSQFGDDLIAANLEALKANQREDGGWPIKWPPISPACELEWRGWVTVGALTTLRVYGE